MITYYKYDAPGLEMAAWQKDQFSDRFAIVRNRSEMFLAWNGPVYSPQQVAEDDRLLAHFKAARAEFEADMRPEVGLLYRQFEAIINAIFEGVQTE